MGGRGRFLVIEGVHRSGKTTALDFLSGLLHDYFPIDKIIKVPTEEEYQKYCKEIPKGQPRSFDEAIQNEEWFLAQEKRRSSMYAALLDEWQFVISSRDYLSMLCFSKAFSKYSGIDTEMIQEERVRDAVSSGKLIVPDLTFWFDIDYHTMIERCANTGRKLEDIWSDERFFNLIRDAYGEVFSRNERRYVKIDGGLPLSEIKEQLSEIVKGHYGKHRV